MTDDKIELSRRKALAGLGTIGAASVGAGLGTSAYFSDEENYTGNTLTAGSLDLKVDWEEHYSDWSEDEVEAEEGTLDVRMSEPDEAAMYTGLPDPSDPLVWVHNDDLGAFMDNTSLEAFPDADNDGVQDNLAEFDFCADGADTPEDLDPTDGLRTENDDTTTEEGPAPLVNLHDVKPGDFGELTLSFHLCDNPGYVWFNGEMVSASENGVTEPESKDPDEEDGTVELLDAIQTLLWYDEDGDNVYEPAGEAGMADVVLVLDDSGSMSGTKLQNAKDAANQLIDVLGSGAQVGVVGFDDDVRLEQSLTTDKSAAKSAVNGLTANGSTNIESAVDAGHEELTGDDITGAITASGNDRDDADPIMVLLSDGAPNVDGDGDGDDDPTANATAAKKAGIEMYTIGLGISEGSPTAALLEDMASTPKNTHAFLGQEQELVSIFSNIAKAIAGEDCFFRGTLRELLGLLETDNGIPLDGDRGTTYQEIVGIDPDTGERTEADLAIGDETADSRECYVNSTTNAIGLAWWLPVDHANEIQTDSVTFDLGFYTEQCRHNDGAGMAPETTTSPGTTQTTNSS